MIPMMITTFYILVWFWIVFEISVVCLTITFLLSFLLILTSFYLVILRVEGFRCTWSNPMTHTHTHTQKHSPFLCLSRLDSRRQGSHLHRDPHLNSTKQWLATDINDAGGIRTRILSKLEVADPRLRPHGHRNLPIEFNVSNFTS